MQTHATQRGDCRFKIGLRINLKFFFLSLLAYECDAIACLYANSVTQTIGKHKSGLEAKLRKRQAHAGRTDFAVA